MTGYEDSDPVLAAGRGSGANGPRFVYGAGDFAIAEDITFRDTEEELPDFDLKGRAAQIKRDFRAWRVLIEVSFERYQPGVERLSAILRSGYEVRLWKLFLKLCP
jgi:hypothetical protein